MKIELELESIYDQFLHVMDLYTQECERQAEIKAHWDHIQREALQGPR